MIKFFLTSLIILVFFSGMVFGLYKTSKCKILEAPADLNARCIENIRSQFPFHYFSGDDLIVDVPVEKAEIVNKPSGCALFLHCWEAGFIALVGPVKVILLV